MTIGSLFSGIGGLELGLERAGLGPVIWQAESDPYCRRVLAKHWPGVHCYDDVQEITGSAERPDIICGGFPCQDISNAGTRAGLAGERSGLWGQYARIIRELQPRIVVVENVSALLGRGLGDVLGDLAACGYDAEWDCIPAAAIGALHRRDRVFIIAYANREGPQRHGAQRELEAAASREQRALSSFRVGGEPEPNVSRVANGVPDRVDRLKALGNAVVPQVAEVIGLRIADQPKALL